MLICRNSAVCLPVLAICGATGTGKSRLAIDIARLFNGEVINVDSMQLYEGLDIATNKITLDQAAGVPHHLLGTFPANLVGRIDVRDYRNQCLNLIHKIRLQNNHIPILAGGTHYYLESVLWSDFLSKSHGTSSQDAEIPSSFFLPADSTEWYAQLKLINPSAAAQLHPNNVRKVRRALIEAIKSRQQLNGPIDHNDPSRIGLSNRSCQPRFPGQTYIFWIDCDKDVLNRWLDRRVDGMVKAGLVDELDRFINSFLSSTTVTTESEKIERLFGDEARAVSDPSVRRGILQSIGFKEFADFLALPAVSAERTSSVGQHLLNSAIERVKISTRQYARRQVRWITNRFLRRPAAGGLPVYRIPVTDILRADPVSVPADWDRLVLAPVVRVVHDHLVRTGDTLMMENSNRSRLNELLTLCPADLAPLPEPFTSKTDNGIDPDSEPVSGPPYVCSACSDRAFSRLEDWQAHVKSRSHQKRVNKLRKRVLLQSWKSSSNDRCDL